MNGVEEPDQGIYEAMSKTQKDNLLVDKKNNATTLCPIQEAMYESILPKICNSQRGLGYFEHEFWCKGEQLFMMALTLKQRLKYIKYYVLKI